MPWLQFLAWVAPSSGTKAAKKRRALDFLFDFRTLVVNSGISSISIPNSPPPYHLPANNAEIRF